MQENSNSFLHAPFQSQDLKVEKNRLNSNEIDQALQGLNKWGLDSLTECIWKEWTFDSFKTAMDFFVKVGAIAERRNHHPEFLSTYTKMRLRLTTHDALGLTQKDFDLATEIDCLIETDFRR